LERKLTVHLRQCRDQPLLASLVAFDNLGGKLSLTVLRDSEFELADTGDQRAAIIATAIAQRALCALPLSFPMAAPI